MLTPKSVETSSPSSAVGDLCREGQKRLRISTLRNTLTGHLGKTFPSILLLTIFLTLVFAYYLWHFRSLSGFAQAIDRCPGLFTDFLIYYHRMGGTILQVADPVPGYFYSAFFALVLVPFGLLPVHAAVWAWGVLQLLTLTVLCVLPLRGDLKSSPRAEVLYVGLVATALPTIHNFPWGQISVLIVACVIAAFHAYSNGKRVLTGIMLAFATAIKFYPALFISYFVLKRDKQVLIAFVTAALVFYVAIPAIILGPAEWVAFEKATRSVLGADSAWISSDVNSQYVVHVGLRWAESLGCPSRIRVLLCF